MRDTQAGRKTDTGMYAHTCKHAHIHTETDRREKEGGMTMMREVIQGEWEQRYNGDQRLVYNNQKAYYTCMRKLPENAM